MALSRPIRARKSTSSSTTFDPQAQARSLARPPPQRPLSLHPDLQLLAQPDRDLVFHPAGQFPCHRQFLASDSSGPTSMTSSPATILAPRRSSGQSPSSITNPSNHVSRIYDSEY